MIIGLEDLGDGKGMRYVSDDLSAEKAQEQFKKLIDWMKSIANEKMRTEEGRQWLRDNWGIGVP